MRVERNGGKMWCGRVRAIVDVADRKNKIVGNYSDAQILMWVCKGDWASEARRLWLRMEVRGGNLGALGHIHTKKEKERKRNEEIRISPKLLCRVLWY